MHQKASRRELLVLCGDCLFQKLIGILLFLYLDDVLYNLFLNNKKWNAFLKILFCFSHLTCNSFC